MTRPDALPPGLQLARTTPVFDEDTVPAGLRSAHQVAEGVWGRLVVHSGELTFRFESSGHEPIIVGAGEVVIIPPAVAHHVETHAAVRFVVEFHRPAADADAT